MLAGVHKMHIVSVPRGSIEGAEDVDMGTGPSSLRVFRGCFWGTQRCGCP